jgi:hypothetical protein
MHLDNLSTGQETPGTRPGNAWHLIWQHLIWHLIWAPNLADPQENHLGEILPSKKLFDHW